MKNRVKTMIRNCMFTTGVSMVLLAIVATILGGHVICIETVFQVLLTNILILFALELLHNFESEYFLIEILVEVGAVLVILILAGAVFHWYSSTPFGILVLMGILIYVIGSFMDVYRVKRDIDCINTKLDSRKNNISSERGSKNEYSDQSGKHNKEI